MEENEETWTTSSGEPYNLRKEDRLHERALGYTLNMMYTLYYEMPDTPTSLRFFPENPDPEQALWKTTKFRNDRHEHTSVPQKSTSNR